MNTAVINIKTHPDVKKQAQAIAAKFGLSLSALINTYLRQVIRTKKIDLRIEEPNEYLQSLIKKADGDYKKGNTSPRFSKAADFIKFLHSQSK